MAQRRPVVGVMGGHTVDDAVMQTAEQLGRLIAERGWVLLNGGRDQGVMAASARGAKLAGGTVIGVLPDVDARRASRDLDVAIVTGMADARNLVNVLSSDVVIACHGSVGTLSEIAMALNHGKRVILMGYDLGSVLGDFRTTGQLTTADGPEDAVRQVAESLPAADDAR